MKLQTKNRAKKRKKKNLQNQTYNKKNANTDETKLCDTKNISSRSNMKLPIL